MLNYIEFYGDGFGRDVTSAGSPKIEGIEGNGPLRVGEIRRNPATIPLAKFCLRHRGFKRVRASCRAADRVGPKSDLPLFTIPYFRHVFPNF